MQIYLGQHDPPVDVIDLIARHVIYSNYSRRQLAYKMTLFWFNHFNTDWEKLRDYYQVLRSKLMWGGRTVGEEGL